MQCQLRVEELKAEVSDLLYNRISKIISLFDVKLLEKAYLYLDNEDNELDICLDFASNSIFTYINETRLGVCEIVMNPNPAMPNTTLDNITLTDLGITTNKTYYDTEEEFVTYITNKLK